MIPNYSTTIIWIASENLLDFRFTTVFVFVVWSQQEEGRWLVLVRVVCAVVCGVCTVCVCVC